MWTKDSARGSKGQCTDQLIHQGHYSSKYKENLYNYSNDEDSDNSVPRKKRSSVQVGSQETPVHLPGTAEGTDHKTLKRKRNVEQPKTNKKQKSSMESRDTGSENLVRRVKTRSTRSTVDEGYDEEWMDENSCTTSILNPEAQRRIIIKNLKEEGFQVCEKASERHKTSTQNERQKLVPRMSSQPSLLQEKKKKSVKAVVDEKKTDDSMQKGTELMASSTEYLVKSSDIWIVIFMKRLAIPLLGSHAWPANAAAVYAEYLSEFQRMLANYLSDTKIIMLPEGNFKNTLCSDVIELALLEKLQNDSRLDVGSVATIASFLNLSDLKNLPLNLIELEKELNELLMEFLLSGNSETYFYSPYVQKDFVGIKKYIEACKNESMGI